MSKIDKKKRISPFTLGFRLDMDVDIRIDALELQTTLNQRAYAAATWVAWLTTVPSLICIGLDYIWLPALLFPWFVIARLVVMGCCLMGLLLFQRKANWFFTYSAAAVGVHLALFCSLVPTEVLAVYCLQAAVWIVFLHLTAVWKQQEAWLAAAIWVLAFYGCFYFFNTKPLYAVFLQGGGLLLLVYLGTIFWVDGLYQFELKRLKEKLIARKSKSQLYLQNAAIKNQKIEIEEKSQVLQQQNEQISQQNITLGTALLQITDSIQYAQYIQKAILGEPEKLQKIVKDSYVFWQPRDIVSGDFYWFNEIAVDSKLFKIPQNKQLDCQEIKLIVLADCTGHGVPGAFMTLLGSSFLDEIVLDKKICQPGEIIAELDRKITNALNRQIVDGKDSIHDGMEIGILLLDTQSKKIHFAGARMPLYRVHQNQINLIAGSKYPVGSTQYGYHKIFETTVWPYETGDCFFMSSDGLPDQFGGNRNKKLLKKGLQQWFVEQSTQPLSSQAENIRKKFTFWKENNPQIDDVLVVGLRP